MRSVFAHTLARLLGPFRRAHRLQIGIGIGVDSVRILGAHAGAVAWVLESGPGIATGSLAEELRLLAERMPLTTRERHSARTVVAFGPSHVQVRRLEGLPSVDDPTVLAEIVRENARRWFLGASTAPLTSQVVRFADGAHWGAAFDPVIVDAVLSACRAAGIPSVASVPAATVVSAAGDTETFVWEDGGERFVVRTQDERIQTVERVESGTAIEPPVRVSATIFSLGESAHRFADAFGAATLDEARFTSRLAIRTKSAPAANVPRGRARAAMMALSAATVAALFAFPLASGVANARATARLSALAAAEAGAARVDRELFDVSATLERVAMRQQRHRSWIGMLARLTEALPAGMAIVTLRVDTLAGVLVVLGPRAGTIVDRLEDVRGIVAPELVGPVTSETVVGSSLERATVRFTLAPAEPVSRGEGPP